MERRVVLHVGTMKTGTSFIQSTLNRNEPALSEAGFAFLGGGFGPQARAVRDMLKLPRAARRNQRRWTRLAREARRAPAAVGLVSMEFLSFAGPEQVRRLVEPFAGAQVQVVLTVRDQLRVLPAQWQTYTRNFGTDSWSEYLRHVRPTWRGGGRDDRAYRTFHRAQDVETILGRWSTAPGVSSVEVVTVPPPDAPRTELWTRFCAATGIPAEVADLEGVRDNESLGYASCDLLRRANPLLADVAPRRYRKGIRPLASTALVPLRAEETRPRLDRRAAAFARDRNHDLRELLERSGHRVWGDLDDLPVPDDLDEYPRTVEEPPEEHVRRAAEAVRRYALGRLGQQGDRAATPAEGPEDLEGLVADAARLLRRAQGWDR